jgi:Holliday junction resolvase
MQSTTTNKDTRSERVIQAAVIKALEKEGWYVIKLIQTNKNGIPDLLCVQHEKTMFIEVKKHDGVLSKLQQYRINEMKNKGISCFVVRSEKQLYMMGIVSSLS